MKFFAQDDVSLSAQRLATSYDVCFTGEAIDQRGRHSQGLCGASAVRTVTARYDPHQFTLDLNGQAVRADELEIVRRMYPAARVLFDATTLDVPELLLLCRAYLAVPAVHAGFVYFEPAGYARATTIGPKADTHAFSLSEELHRLDPIPGNTPELRGMRKAHLMAFLGFEPARLAQVLDPDEGHYYGLISVAFGVPPFQPGWEMHALMRIAASLRDQGDCDVRFTAANNTRSAYHAIEAAYSGLDTQHEPDSRLVLAPFGTKPASVAVALFAAQHSDVRVVFDYPKRKADRSAGVARAHHTVVSPI